MPAVGPRSRKRVRRAAQPRAPAVRARHATGHAPTRSKWVRRGVGDRRRPPAWFPWLSRTSATSTGRAPTRSAVKTRRVDPRPRRQRLREHHRALVVHEQPATHRRQARPHPGAGTRSRPVTTATTTPNVPTTTAPPQPVHLPPPTNRVPTPAAGVEPNEGVWSRSAGRSAGCPRSTSRSCARTRSTPRTTPALMWLDTKLLRATTCRVSKSRAAARTRGARRSPTTERADPRRRVQLRLQDGRSAAAACTSTARDGAAGWTARRRS